jgi:tetratricopeptide (TPR) repeat protein
MENQNNEELHSIIISLLEKEQYKEAAKIARFLRDKFPDDTMAHLLLGIAFMRNEKYDKSRRVVQNALNKFPHEWQLHELMGHVLRNLNRAAEAEKHYNLAIENASDADEEETAMLHFYLAESLWEQSKRDDAIANWKLALEIDPGCIEAEEALEETINEYNEPKAPTPIFDDLYHFQNIHLKRYYALVGRDEFINEDEAKSVIGITMNGWNQFVAPRSRDIDNLNTEERTAFFKSITLDFKDVVVKWRNKK